LSEEGNIDGGLALIRTHWLSSSSAWHCRRPASIHPLPPLAPVQHRRRDLRQVPLEVMCVRTSVLPSFCALFDFFPVGIAMIVQPRRRRSNSPHPQAILIPTGGTPRPPRSRIPSRPFQGGPQTRPQPRRETRRRPQPLSPSSPPSSSSSSSSTRLPPRCRPRASVDP
jgi:hypothetical protein